MSSSLTDCNVLNIEDIQMLQKRNEALSEYILITVAFNNDAYIEKVSSSVTFSGERV